MKNSQALKEIVVKADETSLNNAISEKQIAPDSIVSVMLQPGSGVAIGDSEAKYRVIYRAGDEDRAAPAARSVTRLRASPGVLPPPVSDERLPRAFVLRTRAAPLFKAVAAKAAMAIDAQDYPRVIAGLSRSKNSVASLAYDPAIHEEAQQASTVRFDSLRGFMDARVKPAHDAECVAPLQQRRPR